VTNHKQEDKRAKGYVTRNISQFKSLLTTPLLPTRTKAPAKRVNREIPQLQQEEMRQANQQNMEEEEQQEKAASIPRRSKQIKADQTTTTAKSREEAITKIKLHQR
jgi:hypothetical protein